MWRSGHAGTRTVDEIDGELLACLADDARMTVTAMTERTGLSVPATRQRLMRLLNDRVVRIRTRPNPLSDRVITTRVTMEASGDTSTVAERLARLPNVTYVSESTGRGALAMEMVCATEEQVRLGYRQVTEIPGVGGSRLVRYARVLVHSGRW